MKLTKHPNYTDRHRFMCLACYRPDAFGEIVEVGKSHDLGLIKTLGEKWVMEKKA